MSIPTVHGALHSTHGHNRESNKLRQATTRLSIRYANDTVAMTRQVSRVFAANIGKYQKIIQIHFKCANGPKNCAECEFIQCIYMYRVEASAKFAMEISRKQYSKLQSNVVLDYYTYIILMSPPSCALSVLCGILSSVA